MITIELPSPPPELSPNFRSHWATKAKAVKQYRRMCGWLATQARLEHGCLMPPVAAAVTFFFLADGRRRDQDNAEASLKAAWDGLVDAGLILGDDSAQLKIVSVAFELGTPRVVVELSTVHTVPGIRCGQLKLTVLFSPMLDPLVDSDRRVRIGDFRFWKVRMGRAASWILWGSGGRNCE